VELDGLVDETHHDEAASVGDQTLLLDHRVRGTHGVEDEVELVLELLELLLVVHQDEVSGAQLEGLGLLAFACGDDRDFVAHGHSESQAHLAQASQPCDRNLLAALVGIGVLQGMLQGNSRTKHWAGFLQRLILRYRDCESAIDHEVFGVASESVSFAVGLSMEVVLHFGGLCMGESSVFTHLFVSLGATLTLEARLDNASHSDLGPHGEIIQSVLSC